jgi:hypothetical protein
MIAVRSLRRHLPRFPWNRLDPQLDADDVLAAIGATEARAQAEFSEPDVRAFLLSSRPAAISPDTAAENPATATKDGFGHGFDYPARLIPRDCSDL